MVRTAILRINVKDPKQRSRTVFHTRLSAPLLQENDLKTYGTGKGEWSLSSDGTVQKRRMLETIELGRDEDLKHEWEPWGKFALLVILPIYFIFHCVLGSENVWKRGCRKIEELHPQKEPSVYEELDFCLEVKEG